MIPSLVVTSLPTVLRRCEGSKSVWNHGRYCFYHKKQLAYVAAQTFNFGGKSYIRVNSYKPLDLWESGYGYEP